MWYSGLPVKGNQYDDAKTYLYSCCAFHLLSGGVSIVSFQTCYSESVLFEIISIFTGSPGSTAGNTCIYGWYMIYESRNAPNACFEDVFWRVPFFHGLQLD